MDLETLNKQQRAAVLTQHQHVRIVAGAGSGKTRVLTMRMAWLIEEAGIAPQSICAITFTNKAANEMKQRMIRMLANHSGGVHISTIHSLCVRILREDATAIGIVRNFIVMDVTDQEAILRDAYKARGIERTQLPMKRVLGYISGNKSARVDVQRALELAGENPRERQKAMLYGDYLRRQRNYRHSILMIFCLK